MDYLHSCYTTPVRWRPDSDETITIRWYRAAPGASVYTAAHAFGSTVWDDDDFLSGDGPGEVPDSRTWIKCGTALYPGTAPVSNPDWLLTGVPAGQCPPLPSWYGDVGFAGTCRVLLQQYRGRFGLWANYTTAVRVLAGQVGYSGQFTITPSSFEGQVGYSGQFTITPNSFEGQLGFDGSSSISMGGFIEFGSSGTWTVPAGVTSVAVQVWGTGGNGQPGVSSGGGGGGGGEYAGVTLTVTPGQLLTIQCNAGGANWCSTTAVAPLSTSEGALANAGGDASGATHGTGGTGGIGATLIDGADGGDGYAGIGGGGGGGGTGGPGSPPVAGTAGTLVAGGIGGVAGGGFGGGGGGGIAFGGGTDGTLGGGGGDGYGIDRGGEDNGGAVALTW
jgi:hypothetical protein